MSGLTLFKNDSQYPLLASDRNPFTFHDTILAPFERESSSFLMGFIPQEYHFAGYCNKNYFSAVVGDG